MRDYAKVSPRFWIGHTGRRIRQFGLETQLTALYLMTCPHSTMIGVYYLPISFIVHETGISFEGASQALQSLCQAEFCSYDAEMEYVWVHEMALFQIGDKLKANDNRVKGINEDYENLPNLSFLAEFYEKYHADFLLQRPRQNRAFLQAPLKPLLSQEQEQEQEQEQKQDQEQEQKKLSVAQARPRETEKFLIQTIFEHWKKTLEHPNAVLDDKRISIIRKALKAGYSVAQLCDAITGCSYTPHNLGQNERGQRYDGLHIILRDADQIDRFIHNYQHPPRVKNASDTLLHSNCVAGQKWLDKKQVEDTCYEQV